MKEIILASESKYKKSLLKQLGLDFTTATPLFDEDKFDKSKIEATHVSKQMSYLKGVELSKKYPNKIIISADQVCLIDEQILSKPGSVQGARETLKTLSNKTHKLMTSYALFSGRELIEKTVTAKLKMRKLTESQIDKYVELDKPLDCAGSYKLESYGITLFEEISVSDHTSIIGLPLIFLAKDLEGLGVKFFE